MTHPPTENPLLRAWQKTLARRGDAEAVFAPSGTVLRTFAQIEAEAGEVEECFSAIAPQSVVGVQLGNSERWPAVLLALLRRRLIVLPIGRHMENAELDLALETCHAAVLATIDPSAGLQLTRCAPFIGRDFHWDEPLPDLLKLTSGITSLPRAIRFRAVQLVADCENICDTMGLTEEDRNFGVIPFSHSYGFSSLLLPLLCRGIPLVASEDRMPRAILNDLASSGATVFPGMPVFYQKFAAMQNAPKLPRMRLCISAGSLLPAAVAAAFTGAFGLKIHAFYGSSECGGIAYDAHGRAGEVEGFVGTPMRGVQVTAAEGDAGPIAVRSAAVGDDYFPQRDRAALGDGRFVPGDLIRVDERGLQIVGRASDVINIAGRKLNPLEVEAQLARYPGVRQVVVFGVPSALRGEEAVACIAGDVQPPDVMRFSVGRLSGWQVPREVWVVPEIPTNERGKISRRLLAERFLAYKESRPRGVRVSP